MGEDVLGEADRDFLGEVDRDVLGEVDRDALGEVGCFANPHRPVFVEMAHRLSLVSFLLMRQRDDLDAW